MKYLKIGIYELSAVAIIVFASFLRILLASQGWPISNSDEGTMGIMALHIAYHGEHPLFFYGQNYMGSLEAYLGAVLFHFFGASLFTLRLGVILLVALFLVSMYLLTSLLFSKQLALVTLALLSLGSNVILTRQIMATGGSAETLLFSSLAFLLASWLSLIYSQDPSRKSRWRYLGYGGFGLVVGLGLWSDMIILPFVAMAALLLLLFCWRDLWSWAPLCLVLGLMIGTFPLIDYNYRRLHTRGSDSLFVLLKLFQGSTSQSPHTLSGLIHAVKGTILVSLPTATGNPFCPVSEEWQYFPYSSPHTTGCTMIHASWGLGYLVLWAIALVLTLRTLWQLRQHAQASPEPAERSAVIRQFARLILLGSAALALTAYAFSSGPVSWPGIHARYLMGLLIVTPAVISPLWSGISTMKPPLSRLAKVKAVSSGGMLLLIGILLLIGTVKTFSEMPSAQVISRQQDMLIHHLLRIGVRHVYTDYWTCDSMAFESEEQIICVVVDDNLHPSHNRYMPYIAKVSADRYAAYVFPLGYPQAMTITKKAARPGAAYQRFVFDGYVVYKPLGKSP